ncbi:hypothetical protein F0562_010674 [Nyssa sinensis]|uniref:Exocyst subunit Exo70 family protein n=1 Tax=Nyssa sinensis TaxID=561372 RepID=A0A5J5A466_9ASTE|nr:hypothetical protein F0562_010674 [Nyssa sinensis]
MEPPHNVSVAFESAVSIILQRDSSAAREGMIFEGDRNEIDQYLQAVDEIARSMKLMSTSEDWSEANIVIQTAIARANSVIQIAIARLVDEFVNILSYPFNPRYSSSSSSLTDTSLYDEDYLDYDAPSTEAVYHLRSIVERMNSVGHVGQCIQAYRKVRKTLMEARCCSLGTEKLSTGDVRGLEAVELEAMIKRWKRIANVCVRGLFAIEKQLCHEIFQGLGIDTEDLDAYFLETVSAIQLLNFAEAMSTTCPRSPERLFSILELLQTMSYLLPDMEVLFQSKASESIRIQAAEILRRLSGAAKEILCKFEKAVLHELSPFPVPGGAIDSLTMSVMKYIIRISVYEKTLVELPSMDLKYSNDLMIPDMKFQELGEQTPLALQLIRIIVILQFKLEVKSKEYNDAALAHLFMISNVHYIIERIEGCSELKTMIGTDYFKQLMCIFGRAVISYQRSTWLSVFHCLRDEWILWMDKTAVRGRLKSFNALFKKVLATQAAWSVPDLQLREELRILILHKLIPCYYIFMRRFCLKMPKRPSRPHQNIKDHQSICETSGVAGYNCQTL